MRVSCPKCRQDCSIDDSTAESISCPSCGFSISTAHSAGPTVDPAPPNAAPSMPFDVTPPEHVTSARGEHEFSADPTASLDEAAGGVAQDSSRWFGRYRVVRYVASGSFGDVFEAFDSKLGRTVALKVPRRERFASDDAFHKFVVRFQAEGRRAAQLSHPGIVGVYDVEADVDKNEIYIVMEFIRGMTLEQRLRERRPSVAQIVEWVAQVAEAVHVAHVQGFVHRDLKPSNILIDDSERARVVDFGLALHESEQRHYRGQVAGTIAYMSPEQVQGRPDLMDGRTDVWSLGAVLYRCLARRSPFPGSGDEQREQIVEREPRPFAQIDEALPKALEDICLRGCLVKPVAQRYGSARELSEKLRAWLRENNDGQFAPSATPTTSGDSTATLPPTCEPSSGARPVPVSRRRWISWAVGATVAGVAGAGGIAAITRVKRPPRFADRFFRIPEFAAASATDEPANLLLSEPIEVIWPATENHDWSWKASPRTLVLPSTNIACLALGFTIAQNFRLEIEFRKPALVGLSGIFLGMSPVAATEPIDLRPTSGLSQLDGNWIVQAIGLERRADATFHVNRFLQELQLTSEGFDGGKKIQLTPEPVLPSEKYQLLSIEVYEGRICEVAFGTKVLHDIVKSPVIDKFIASRCRGVFGIVNYSGSVTITRAEFRRL